MKAWIRKNQGILLIALLLLVSRVVQVLIFMHYDNVGEVLTSILSAIGFS